MNGNRGARERVTVDTCIFSAWFKQEADKPLSAIERMLESFDQGNIILYSSILTLTELKAGFEGQNYFDLFKSFSDRENFKLIDVDPPIAELAGSIRKVTKELNHKGSRGQKKPQIKLVDSIIVASAIHHGTDSVYTYDPGMQSHSETDLVQGITICDPPAPPERMQRSLIFDDN
ncbi:PIN domain protein [Gimesia maris]|uniref:type II toxin-antitoxin system VapC family toxin n=1 Tax=Gimesia maris TaxID=122 RepID=UPI0011882B66|nr:PIN domain-containing protein [Gimesia maris]QDT77942.1 PIN domain protein [Gimesia maris]